MYRPTILLFLLGAIGALLQSLSAKHECSTEATIESDDAAITSVTINDYDLYWPYHIALVEDSVGDRSAKLSKGLRGVFLNLSEDGESVYPGFNFEVQEESIR